MMEHEYKPDKTTVYGGLIVLVILQTIVSGYMWLTRSSILAPLIVLVASAYAARPMVRLLFMKVALRIDAAGITDYTRPLGFIPWKNIKGARIGSAGFGETIELDLHNRDAVVGGQSFVGNFVMPMARSESDLPSIGIVFVNCRAREVLAIVSANACPSAPEDDRSAKWSDELKSTLRIPPEARRRKFWFAP